MRGFPLAGVLSVSAMQSLCADDRPCLHFFPGMGFRPAVHVLQRDQYGDRLVLVIGDDGPIEGKVVPGYSVTEMSFDPYAVVSGKMPGEAHG